MGTVGKPALVLDAAERVAGSAMFAPNVRVPGMLHARVLRSPYAHARILKLDASKAERLRGVAGVLTGRDLERGEINSHYGPVLPDRPLVAMDKVRYQGEPVAVVAAVDEDTAEEALGLIEVEYEELPALVTAEEALQPDAPAIHDQIRRREFLTYPDIVLNTEAGKNIFNYYRLRKGDAEAAMAKADHVFEDTFRTPHQQHCSLEPHVAVARMDSGRITIWSACSSPYTARFQVAETLRIPQSRVRIIAYNIGGAYGGKTYPRHEPLLAALCWRLGGRPVRLELKRNEEFYTVTRHASATTLRTGVRKDGTIVARQARILWGAGAYADVSPRTIKNGGYGVIGPYNIPDVSVDSYAVYTNTTPSGGFRGYAIPQVTWAYESQMDIIAAALGIDPLELRLKNIVHDGDQFSTGQVLEDLHYPQLLNAVAQHIGLRSPESRVLSPESKVPAQHSALGTQDSGLVRGKGVACTIKTTITPSTSTAMVKLNEDGSGTVITSTTEIGQGSRTILAQMAADELRLPLERMAVTFADTDVTPWDQTTSSSRSTFMMGTAVRLAAADVRGQLFDLAAGMLEVSPNDLEAEDGWVFIRGARERGLDYGEVVRRSRRGNLLGHGTFSTRGGLDPVTGLGIASCHFHQSAAGAEVEVDTQTGRVTVLNVDIQAFVGKVVNPTLASLQNDGNAAFGVGQALMEEMVYEGGRLVNPNLSDYMIPSAKDLPRACSNGLLERPGGEGEPHGLGEAAAPVVPVAIGNAIFDAVGVRVKELPITPEKVLRALRRLEVGG
ncbi:MAG: xanthine dehydrogenase family protein [Chloroflexi bacterium]|nr:xanthine dehydrogenase family protein [Chloroflexota bacterium]